MVTRNPLAPELLDQEHMLDLPLLKPDLFQDLRVVLGALELTQF